MKTLNLFSMSLTLNMIFSQAKNSKNSEINLSNGRTTVFYFYFKNTLKISQNLVFISFKISFWKNSHL